jgi:hypothetical protein
MSGISEDDLKSAIDRIGMSPDGELLYLWLQRRLTRVLQTTEPGALQQENGQRILATELMGHLSAGINEAHGGSRSDRIVTFKLPERAAVRLGARGAIRRGTIPGEPEPGQFEPGSSGNPGPGDTA